MDSIENKRIELEEMASFFDKRVDTYDEHMKNEVDGSDQYYIETAKYIPHCSNLKLLDLGCGTGLELKEIFKINPTVNVTGIDLSKKMLAKLKEKYEEKQEQISLINESYVDIEYGKEAYGAVVSVETLHHFAHQEKLKIYKKIYDSLIDGGVYVETDYVAKDQEYEDYFFNELKRIKEENKITEGFYHYDTPCTVENIIILMEKAGFKEAELKWREEGTAIIVAKK
ncbi:class I SAM-dependent DNA methyltransferase [Clostridium oryzae]|uniref:tRNA (Cmo5U34)-methyltransferase n=1 Tax=Clostridium oryzae TaxID=1450648 RepID=A0A1V4ISI7_9CLOT|nr:class I SAM-dependent methyltransferase [Clostridium oryzae]OPJ62859.1 tRNA (cmo5U34)-methyltransferase [Clostridium oryzae]